MEKTDSRKYKPLLIFAVLLGLFLGSFNVTYAVSTFIVPQGGTGVNTFTSGQLIYGNGINPLSSVATTSASCSGTASCTPFTVIGNSPITITGAGGGGGGGSVGTSSIPIIGNLSYWTGSFPATLGNVATTTLTASGVVSVSNSPVVIGGSGAAITITGGSNSQVLGWAAGVPTWVATTTFSSPLLYSAGNVTCQTASGSLAGCLSSTDWTTFNGKQASGSYITALTGDVTASGPGSVAATLATVNSNVGSFTNANVTVNGKGLITAASNGSSISTTSGISIGQGAYFTGTSPTVLGGFSTTTASCSGSASCTPFTVIGSSPVTISASGGGGGSGSVSTSTADASGEVTFFTSNNATPALIGGNTNFTFSTSNGQLSIPNSGWFALGGSLLAYSSSTNRTAIFGIGAGGNTATTSASIARNVAVGFQALSANATNAGGTQGVQNTAVGNIALVANTTGVNNTSIGASSLDTLTTGSDNTALGFEAGSGLTVNSSRNTFVGKDAAQTSGANIFDNVGVGYQAGSVTTGWNNTFVGANAGINSTSGNNNTAIGFNSWVPSPTANNQLVIGNLLYGILPATTTAATFSLPISGTFGIGTSSPFAKFSIQSNNGDTNTTLFAIASSTSGATTTLFSISNTGNVFTQLSNGCVQASSGILTSTGSSCNTGTVTAVSVASANGFAGSSSGGATPQLTLSTTITGLLKGNGTAISAAAYTDFPTIAAGTGLANGTGATAAPTAVATSSWFGLGTNGFILAEVGGIPTWVATTTLANISGTLAETKGGTNQTSYTQGDILYASGSNTLSKLGIGTPGQVLGVVGSIPQWVATSSSGGGAVSSVSNADGTLTISPTTGAVVASIALAHANIWTGLQQFNGNASSTQFSSRIGYFGGTATTTITSTGAVGIASSTPWTLLDIRGSGPLQALKSTTNTANTFNIENSQSTSTVQFGTLDVSNGFFWSVATSTTILQTSAFDFGVDTFGHFSVGSTTPFAQLSVSSPSSTVPFVVDSLQNNTTYRPFWIDIYGHKNSTGPTPTLSSCGTSPSIVGNDGAGIVTVGSVSATGCTITFVHPYESTPTCNIQTQTGSITNTFSYTVSSTALVVTETGLTSAILNYECQGLY